MFYLSFLIRDGKVAIEEENGEFILTTANPPTQQDMEESDCSKIQNIFHFDMAQWRHWTLKYQIQSPTIPHRVPVQDATATTWYA